MSRVPRMALLIWGFTQMDSAIGRERIAHLVEAQPERSFGLLQDFFLRIVVFGTKLNGINLILTINLGIMNLEI